MKKTYTLTFLLSISTAVGLNAATIHTGLLNYWALDGNGNDTAGSFTEGTSTVADDMTVGGTAGSATINGSGGLFGGAADFERTVANDGRLSTGDSADVNFEGESLTTSLWVNFDDNASGNWQAILVKGEGANYRISTNRNASNNNANAAFGAGDINSGVNVRDGNWHHILVTAINSSTVTLFVDGVSTGTQSTSNIINQSTSTDPTAPELWLGNNTQNPDRMWDGMIDDVAQWDRALSTAEVTEIYNAGLAGTSLGQIPEPSSTALLGLGGLALILRRRK